jgi:hypothetical protein
VTEIDYGALYDEAIATSGLGSEVLPDDTYTVKIATVKPDASKAGKFKVGIRLQVIGGPFDGKSTWVNQTFSPESPGAVAVFLRIMRELGVPEEVIKARPAQPPAVLAQYIVQGSTGTAVLAHHDYGTNDDGTPRRFQDLKKFTLTPGATPAAAAPAAPVAAAAQAVPVPEVPAVPVPPVVTAQTFPQVPAPGAVQEPF